MAKDPAFLFYPNDWMGGTMILSRHQKGCYIDLLVAQFNNGPLSLDTIKAVLGQDQAMWTVLSKKFKQTAEGLWYNERLETEKDRRRQFIDRQKENGKKGGRKPTLNPTLNPNESNKENENRNEDEIKNSFGKSENLLSESGFWVDAIKKDKSLSESQIENTIEFIRLVCSKTITPPDVIDYFEAFKIQQFGKHEWYNSFEDLLSHFRNSLKLSLNGSYKQTPGSSEKGTSKDRIAALKNW